MGEIIEDLRKNDGLDSTIIFFFSDNGRPFPGAKRALSDDGLHVPLIVRYPHDLHPGMRSTELVSLVDLAPTLLSITHTHTSYHVHLQGNIFLGPKKSKKEREAVVATRDRIDQGEGRMRMIRTKQDKLIKVYDNKSINNDLGAYEYFKADGLEDSIPFYSQNQSDMTFSVVNGEEKLTILSPSRLKYLNGQLNKWEHASLDLGRFNEDLIHSKMWPNGKQPLTEPPHIFPKKHTFQEDVKVNLYSHTSGASIAYKVVGKDDHWRLYTEPILLDESVTIKAKAIRYGFRHSPVSEFAFHKIKD